MVLAAFRGMALGPDKIVDDKLMPRRACRSANQIEVTFFAFVGSLLLEVERRLGLEIRFATIERFLIDSKRVQHCGPFRQQGGLFLAQGIPGFGELKAAIEQAFRQEVVTLDQPGRLQQLERCFGIDAKQRELRLRSKVRQGQRSECAVPSSSPPMLAGLRKLIAFGAEIDKVRIAGKTLANQAGRAPKIAVDDGNAQTESAIGDRLQELSTRWNPVRRAANQPGRRAPGSVRAPASAAC